MTIQTADIGNHVKSENHKNIVDKTDIEQSISDLLLNGSIEYASKDRQEIKAANGALPFGTRVYLPFLPNQSLESRLSAIAEIHDNGFDPVPHIAARRVPSQQELKDFLDTIVSEYGVHIVLLIGGDSENILGPYEDSSMVLKDGVLAESGIKEVGLAGYPEGHPRISNAILEAALNEKLILATKSGMGSYIVTQFSFAPSRIINYCSKLARIQPGVPVYVGMAGPTDPAVLIRYARICGVSKSLRALTDIGFKAVKMLSQTEPNKQLTMLARHCASRENCNVVGTHIFSFGGFLQSAKWMQQKSLVSEHQ